MSYPSNWERTQIDPLFSENVTWSFANSSQTDAAVAALPSRSSEIVSEPAYAQPAANVAAGESPTLDFDLTIF